MAFLVRQQKFDSSTILRSLAYSVALSVRQAQVYGTSVRENTPGSFAAGTAASSYGICWSSGNKTGFTLFADANNNGACDSGETVQSITLNNGYLITQFCATRNTSLTRCSTDTLTSLAILFKRPNPDAIISTNISGESYASAKIQITGPGGDTRSVTISATGQITVGALGTYL